MKWYPFSEVITDVTSKFRKIKATDYKAEGRFKIIDQGQKEIAGYTDDESLVNKTHSPIIVFGDHTRALKYEESTIALGADGAKALAVNPKLFNALYIFYYLRSISLKAAGYSRHFKFLKQVEIPIPEEDGKPNLDDQKRIAHLLGKVEGLIARRKQHLQQLDDLLKSVFLEMFGDPVRNEKGWDTNQLAKECLKITDGTHDTPERLTSGVPFITGKHVRPFSIDYNGCDYVLEEDHRIIYSRCDPRYGDVLYTNIGVNLGTAAMNVVDYEFSMKNVALLRPVNESLNPRFLEHYLNYEKIKNKIISDLSSGGAQKFLGLGQIKKIGIILPPLDLQNQFATIVEKVDGLKSLYQQSLTDLKNLYGTLSQKAFKGELDLSRVSLGQAEQREIGTRQEKRGLETSAEPQSIGVTL
ncbi:MAG: restriction endonuclease subunit S [Proteobacteria bacterium]|nr:restriction endonuclease subunit S [Pseudomonadota bacterium]MBU1736959.1 restriction endonuclease subunit S [Pseudomonadota bacterium]